MHMKITFLVVGEVLPLLVLRVYISGALKVKILQMIV